MPLSCHSAGMICYVCGKQTAPLPVAPLLLHPGLHPGGSPTPAGLKGTEWAQAQVDTIRRKLFKIGAIVHVSVRRIRLQMSSAYPWKDIYARAFHALRC